MRNQNKLLRKYVKFLQFSLSLPQLFNMLLKNQIIFNKLLNIRKKKAKYANSLPKNKNNIKI